MSRATVELDFLGMEKCIPPSKSHLLKLFDRRKSFRGIQNAISKINPELLKSVISSGTANQTVNGKLSENGNLFSPNVSFSVASTPKGDQTSFPALPVYGSTIRSNSESLPQTSPLTIFYKGTVSVFDVPRDKAESILKLAVEGRSNTVVSSNGQPKLIDALVGDLQQARRNSLHRFLKKRKERLMSVSPYDCRPKYAFSEQKRTGEPSSA